MITRKKRKNNNNFEKQYDDKEAAVVNEDGDAKDGEIQQEEDGDNNYEVKVEIERH